jgi:hypothetical protein
MTGELGRSLVPDNELIGDIVEVVADDLRLRAYSQDIIPDALDQRCLPARRNGAKGVPRVAGDQTEPRRFGPQLFLDIAVSLA